MRRIILALIFVFGVFGMAAPAGAQDLNCADFGTQEEAQAAYNADPSDPHGLDRDNDGIACESLVSGGGGGGTAEAPVDGGTGTVGGDATDELPATGIGPMTATSGANALVFGVSAMLLASGALVLRKMTARQA